MEETFVYREIQQNKNKFQCASDVLKEYPRYVDVEEGFLVKIHLKCFLIRFVPNVNILKRSFRILNESILPAIRLP